MRKRRVIVPGIVAALALAGAELRGEEEEGRGLTMRMSFRSREYHYYDWCGVSLPNRCLSYVRLGQPGKARPLYVSGRGRRGELRLQVQPRATGHEVKSDGRPLVEYGEYSVCDGVDASRYACSAWVTKQPGIRVVLAAVRGWEEQGHQMGPFLQRRKPPARDEKLPTPVYRATADFEVTVGERKVRLEGCPAEFRFEMLVARKFGWVLPYWRMTYRAKTTVEGAKLGLTGKDAKAIEMSIVGGGLMRAPTLQSMTPDVAELPEAEEILP